MCISAHVWTKIKIRLPNLDAFHPIRASQSANSNDAWYYKIGSKQLLVYFHWNFTTLRIERRPSDLKPFACVLQHAVIMNSRICPDPANKGMILWLVPDCFVEINSLFISSYGYSFQSAIGYIIPPVPQPIYILLLNYPSKHLFFDVRLPTVLMTKSPFVVSFPIASIVVAM